MVGWPALISAGLLSTILPLQYRAQSASFAAVVLKCSESTVGGGMCITEANIKREG